MLVTRRKTFALAVGSVAAGYGLSRPAIANTDPLKFGWLGAFTGPTSAAGLGVDLGVQYELGVANQRAGKRKIELISRDSQSDPTKAVNAAQEMISRQGVHVIFGPTNSGESLAMAPLLARTGAPNLCIGGIDSLIDPVKLPSVFRIAAHNSQWEDTVRQYCVKVLKVKKVAVVGDNTGYGTTIVASNSAAFKKDGVELAYSGVIDPTLPDVSPDMLRMRDAGAEVIVLWSLSPGLIARMLNAREKMGWKVSFAGHPALGAGEVGRLIEKPSNWSDVFTVGYKNCTLDENGKLPAQTQEFVDAAKKTIDFSRTLLYWVGQGVDGVRGGMAIADGAASLSKEDVVKFLSTAKFTGILGNYAFSGGSHEGFSPTELVMCHANSNVGGAFKIAPGYASK